LQPILTKLVHILQPDFQRNLILIPLGMLFSKYLDKSRFFGVWWGYFAISLPGTLGRSVFVIFLSALRALCGEKNFTPPNPKNQEFKWIVCI
jgi:hypothetical protein